MSKIRAVFLRDMVLIAMLIYGIAAGYAQNNGVVTITASPESVCVGEPVSLKAFCVPSDPEPPEPLYDFNNNNQGWTTIDDDGHGDAWSRVNYGGVDNTGCMRAAWNTNYAHNDYLVSPQITLGQGVFGFYAKKESATFSDTFKVYLSTTGHTNASSFNIELTNGNVEPSTAFTRYEFDLSAYSGHGYIAIVYTAAANQYYLYIDNVYYGEPTPYVTVGNTYDFESGLQGWTKIDADGDGNNWMHNDYFGGHDGSIGIVYSQSYDNTYGNYYPDNYLVSPSKMSVQQGAFVSFWACAQDESWAAEHFGVAISTTNNTNASAFTTIKEWTMTANGKNNEKGSPTKMTRGGSKNQGVWKRYYVDLSAYIGQNIWIAIRHFDVVNMFYLNVDDIVLYSGGNSSITYQWNNGMNGPNITVNPTQTTTYSVTAYAGGSSVGSAQRTIAVVSPNVNITITSGSSSICEEEEVTLHADVNMPAISYYLPGDILCTDGSVVKPANWPCGKTAKGIVFYVDNSGQHGWAVGLQQYNSVKWSSENAEISGLQKYSHWMDAISDIDGEANSRRIRNQSNPDQYPAAWAVNFNDGWYLPAIGQLNILFGEILKVNSSLTKVGGTVIDVTTNNKDLWSSSTSTNTQYSMTLYPKNGRIGFETKSSSKYVREVIDF